MRFALAGRSGFRHPAANTIAALGLIAGIAAAGPALAQSQPFPMDKAQAAAPAKPATPPSAGQIKLANELLVANGEASAFDALIPGVIEQAANSFVQANPDLIRDLRDVAKSMIPQYENRRAEITAILAQTYAAQFSEAELTELLTFYRSPVGVKLVQRRQELLDEGLRGIQTWSAKFSREMEARVREEMKKRGFTI
ncbi:DUF2059 domain-containing protein [Ancylobacter sp. G4_0304]|uniref:DUF2059 domain-containing protein n=1 Tax=Ancylobacter sp. G4_0304 TaxID=3114289 RepID=UPI0039C6F2C9